MGKLNTAQLDELVDQTTIDCYNADETVTGFYTMLEDKLQTPFETVVLGVPGTVT